LSNYWVINNLLKECMALNWLLIHPLVWLAEHAKSVHPPPELLAALVDVGNNFSQDNFNFGDWWLGV